MCTRGSDDNDIYTKYLCDTFHSLDSVYTATRLDYDKYSDVLELRSFFSSGFFFSIPRSKINNYFEKKSG